MNRVNFLIDGFNLYHSVKDAETVLKSSTKWLNIKKLCSAYLPLIRNIVKDKTELGVIYYFSAYAKHLESANPDLTKRHQKLITCLEDTGIIVEMSRFKAKEVTCHRCGQKFIKYEEKETDVSIALKLIETFFNDECDSVVLMTGDTDIAPAIKTANRLFPSKQTLFAFPYKRENKELSNLSPGSFKINKMQYVKYQFSDPHQLSDGTLINKSSSW